jgi:hypothetical protein
MSRHDPETGIVLLGFLVVVFFVVALVLADWLVNRLAVLLP